MQMIFIQQLSMHYIMSNLKGSLDSHGIPVLRQLDYFISIRDKTQKNKHTDFVEG